MKTPYHPYWIALLAISFFSSFVTAQKKAVDPQSIYARIGGQEAIDAAVDIFYKKVEADDKVNYLFENVNMKTQARKQKQFLGAVFGGPIAWQGKNMREAHQHLSLTEEHFAAIAGHLSATLQELKVDPQLIGEIMELVGSTKEDVLNRPKKE